MQNWLVIVVVLVAVVPGAAVILLGVVALLFAPDAPVDTDAPHEQQTSGE